ncbi:MAG: 23S rRNA (uracil(1939)-C(5))-methyltransferase RlmD [Burkholderiales bacterium]|nr:23S rRNA (uracil(1939)-C(5))-methyltransferase RlmD [Burkholderiales bacterium]
MVHIQSLDLEGRGVARVDGKVTFVEGALPGECVEIEVWRRKRSFDLARVREIATQSSQRVAPACPFFERCGGCSLQHLDARAQVAMKQRVLEEDLKRIGGVHPDVILPPVHGASWGYRTRARFAVRHVPKKGGALVGFHERKTHLVVEMDSCAVLAPRASALIAPLRALVSGLHLAARLPQIEVAVGEGQHVVLCLRVLDQPDAHDLGRLRDFQREHGVEIHLQPKGPDTLQPLDPASAQPLAYRLPEFDLTLQFRSNEFTQINQAVNRLLVSRAVRLLRPGIDSRVADLFCGLGNFTLPLARCGARVVGIEGSADLVARARMNAHLNGLADTVRFEVGDLFQDAGAVLAWLGRLDAMLLDPPRDGAQAVVECLGETTPDRIVYVSCNPATLARDAAILVKQKGYRLAAAGVVNMFPHTSHIESIALFTH